MACRGVDHSCVDCLFSQEELLVRQTARRFAGVEYGIVRGRGPGNVD
jgi:hypothetical protein